MYFLTLNLMLRNRGASFYSNIIKKGFVLCCPGNGRLILLSHCSEFIFYSVRTTKGISIALGTYTNCIHYSSLCIELLRSYLCSFTEIMTFQEKTGCFLLESTVLVLSRLV